MFGELRPYAEYKESSVDWLGGVPAHWEVRQLGRIGRFFKGRGGTKSDDTEEGIPCIRYGDLYTKHRFHITESRARIDPSVSAAYTAIEHGDVLFAGSGETVDEIGKSAANLIRGPACCGGDVIVFRPHIALDAVYSGYAFDCQPTAHQKARIGRGFTVIHVYATDLKYVSVAVPPLAEQSIIARFLEDRTQRIDRYIRTKEKLLGAARLPGGGLLDEFRNRLIADVVTGKFDVRDIG